MPPDYTKAKTPQEIAASGANGAPIQGTVTPTLGASGQVTGNNYVTSGGLMRGESYTGKNWGTIGNVPIPTANQPVDPSGGAIVSPDTGAITGYVGGSSGPTYPSSPSSQASPTPAPTSAAAQTGSASAPQGDVSGAGTTAGGTYSRYAAGGAGVSPEEDYLNRQFKQPESEEEIFNKRMQQAQSEANAIADVYNAQLVEQNRMNEMRSAETNAQSVLSGLTGSTEAAGAMGRTMAVNAQDNAKIQAQKGLALVTLYNNIRKDAITEARQQKLDAKTAAEDVLARREKDKTKALADVANLFKSGVTFDGLKNSDPAVFARMVQAAGSEAQLKAMSVLNAPAEEILDKKFENGVYSIVRKNPLTGAITIQSFDSGLPPDVKTQVIENNLYSSTDGGKTWQLAIAGQPDALKQLQIQKLQQELNGGPTDNKKTGAQLSLLKDAMATARVNAFAAGRPTWRTAGEQFLAGANPYTYLENSLDTIKVNLLALNTDPNVRKFFGPQMSVYDSKMMQSGGSTLDAAKQDPELLKQELDRVQDLFDRITRSLPPEIAKEYGLTTSPGDQLANNVASGTVVMTGPDNVDYQVPADQVDAFIQAGGKRK